MLFIIFFAHNFLFSQQRTDVQISSEIYVHFIVTDPYGRKTGCDPRGAAEPWFGKELDGIPGANYSTGSLGDSPEEDYQPQEGDIWHEFLYGIDSPEDDGTYLIECVGLKSRKFSLEIIFSREYETVMQPISIVAEDVIDSLEVITYRWEYHGQPGLPIKFEKVVQPQTLRQDLKNCYKLNLVGGESFYTGLTNFLTQFEQSLLEKDSLIAAKALQNFWFQVETAYKKGTGTKTVAQYAYTILNGDVTTLQKSLPQALPIVSYAYLIDTLIATVNRQLSNRQIGSETFVQSLAGTLETAKAQMLKGNMQQAATNIKNVQSKLYRAYEDTQASIQQGKPLPKNFVMQAAWNELSRQISRLLIILE